MVATVVYTHNRAISVGVMLSALFFPRKVAKIVSIGSSFDEARATRTYMIWSQRFFVSTEEILHSFDFEERIEHIKINLTHAHLWNSQAASDKVVPVCAGVGIKSELLGLNHASATVIDRLALHDKGGVAEAELAH